MTYRNWIIDRNDNILHPQFDVVAHHRDYDGPEDNRVVTGATLAEVKAEIDAYEDEHAAALSFRHVIAFSAAVWSAIIIGAFA